MYGAQKEAWDKAHALTSEEGQAIARGKELVGKLALAVPLALRVTSVPEVRVEDFYGAAEVERSTTKIVAFLDRIRPGIKKIDAALKPYLNGESAADLLETAYNELTIANKRQEVARSGAPDKTVQMNETKGRALQLVEDMNRIAKLAYYGQAQVIGRFNKDILLRARRSRSGKAEPAPAPSLARAESGEARIARRCSPASGA